MEKDVTSVDELESKDLFIIFTSWPSHCHNNLLGQYESTLIKLTNAEVQIEDLKSQLDDALGAEDLLVQLTERNLMLGEVRRL